MDEDPIARADALWDDQIDELQAEYSITSCARMLLDGAERIERVRSIDAKKQTIKDIRVHAQTILEEMESLELELKRMQGLG